MAATIPVERLELLLAQHREMEERLLAHRSALLDRDLAAARVELEAHSALIRAHAAEEDATLLPAYEALGLAPRGGSPELFRLEHAKILTWLDELDALQARLEALDEPGAADLLAVLDRQATFRGLMEHHDVRERTYLFPALGLDVPAD